MAFTTKDCAELARARQTVAELEAKRGAAFAALGDALYRAGLGMGHLPDLEEVATHADVLRDALAPFDSGVRVAARAE